MSEPKRRKIERSPALAAVAGPIGGIVVAGAAAAYFLLGGSKKSDIVDPVVKRDEKTKFELDEQERNVWGAYLTAASAGDDVLARVFGNTYQILTKDTVTYYTYSKTDYVRCLRQVLSKKVEVESTKGFPRFAAVNCMERLCKASHEKGDLIKSSLLFESGLMKPRKLDTRPFESSRGYEMFGGSTLMGLETTKLLFLSEPLFQGPFLISSEIKAIGLRYLCMEDPLDRDLVSFNAVRDKSQATEFYSDHCGRLTLRHGEKSYYWRVPSNNYHALCDVPSSDSVKLVLTNDDEPSFTFSASSRDVFMALKVRQDTDAIPIEVETYDTSDSLQKDSKNLYVKPSVVPDRNTLELWRVSPDPYFEGKLRAPLPLMSWLSDAVPESVMIFHSTKDLVRRSTFNWMTDELRRRRPSLFLAVLETNVTRFNKSLESAVKKNMVKNTLRLSSYSGEVPGYLVYTDWLSNSKRVIACVSKNIKSSGWPGDVQPDVVKDAFVDESDAGKQVSVGYRITDKFGVAFVDASSDSKKYHQFIESVTAKNGSCAVVLHFGLERNSKLADVFLKENGLHPRYANFVLSKEKKPVCVSCSDRVRGSPSRNEDKAHFLTKIEKDAVNSMSLREGFNPLYCRVPEVNGPADSANLFWYWTDVNMKNDSVIRSPTVYRTTNFFSSLAT